jgi:hypothetical protein
MYISTEQYNRIINFLDTGMTLEEMEAFEKELLANPALRQQLDFELELRDSFALGKTNSEDVSEVAVTKSTAVISINRNKWFVRAVAAAVIVTVVPLLFIQPKKDTTTIIAQLYDTAGVPQKDTLPVLITARDNNTAQKLTALYRQYFTADAVPENYPMYLADALTNYQNKDYAAIQKLDLNIIPETRGTTTKQTTLELGHYYKGIAFLKNGNTKEALANLQWLQKNCTDEALTLKAEWYMALAYLKNNNADEATGLLKKLAAKSTYHRYSDKAKKLLGTLED